MPKHAAPCTHGTLIFQRGMDPDYVLCNDCGETLDNPIPLKYRCPHYTIDNRDWNCTNCGERMITQRVEADTVISAPNLTPCRDPEHLSAIEQGREFECSTYAYTPDMHNQEEVTIGYITRYECPRCVGTVAYKGFMHIECGRSHVGDYQPVI